MPEKHPLKIFHLSLDKHPSSFYDDLRTTIQGIYDTVMEGVGTTGQENEVVLFSGVRVHCYHHFNHRILLFTIGFPAEL